MNPADYDASANFMWSAAMALNGIIKKWYSKTGLLI